MEYIKIAPSTATVVSTHTGAAGRRGSRSMTKS